MNRSYFSPNSQRLIIWPRIMCFESRLNIHRKKLELEKYVSSCKLNSRIKVMMKST